MTANARRWIAFIMMIVGFTSIHYGCWYCTATQVAAIEPYILLSFPIALPFWSFFALAPWPEALFLFVAGINSLFWGVSGAIFVLRLEHRYWLAHQSRTA